MLFVSAKSDLAGAISMRDFVDALEIGLSD
jgi:hypothetical protein